MQQRTPPLFWWVVGLSFLAALVPTLWPALDLHAAALFASPAGPYRGLDWWWIRWVNDYVPTVFRWLSGAVALAWVVLRGRRWQPIRYALAFVVIAGVVGPGLVVNSVVKDHWNRARPYEVQNFGGAAQFTRAAKITNQCDANCSFVSGHVACGIFLASIALVHRRRQVVWTLVGVSSGLLIGLARMEDMAHWLSDVLWAFPITLMASWLVWRGLLLVYIGRLDKPSTTVG